MTRIFNALRQREAVMTRLGLFGLGVVVLASCDRIVPPTSPDASHAISFSAQQQGDGAQFKEAAAGELVSCARTAPGDVYCWGSNRYGTLGAGDYVDASTPRRVITDVEFASITMSGSHACGLTPRGDAYCWGQNASRELGVASTDVCPSLTVGRVLACSAQPLLVSGGIRFKTIDAGWRHNCGLTAQGEAFCWGWNLYGQLGAASAETCLSDGLNSNPCSTTPVRVSGDLRFKSISAGFWQSCGLTDDEQTYCWGNNALGTFGNGSTTSSPNIPVPAATGVTLAHLSSGSGSACGITEDHVTMCWGIINILGELGDGTNLPHLVPQPIAGDFVTVRSVTAMNENNVLAHTCGIAADGQALCWGSNLRGELGVATTQTCHFGTLVSTCSNVPVAVAGDYRFRSVAVGYLHTCGVTQTGDVLCWGANSPGQLGAGTTVDRQGPVPGVFYTPQCRLRGKRR